MTKFYDQIKWADPITSLYDYVIIMVEIYNEITFIVKLLVAEKAFEKILGHGLGVNVKNTNENLFWKRTIVLVGNIFCKTIFVKHKVIR